MAKSVVCDTRNGLGFPGNEVHNLNETVDVGCVAKGPRVVGLIISTVWGGVHGSVAERVITFLPWRSIWLYLKNDFRRQRMELNVSCSGKNQENLY